MGGGQDGPNTRNGEIEEKWEEDGGIEVGVMVREK